MTVTKNSARREQRRLRFTGRYKTKRLVFNDEGVCLGLYRAVKKTANEKYQAVRRELQTPENKQKRLEERVARLEAKLKG